MFKLARTYSTLGERTLQHLKNTNEKFNNKIRGTFFEKWVKYWKVLGRDYKDVVISVQRDFKEKPIKSWSIVSGLGFLTFCASNNPNRQSFRAKYIQCANEIGLVSSNIANADSVNHLKYIERCFNANLIRYTNLGIFSIIWVDKYSKECDTYESNCSYLKVQYRQFSERILDVGFLNIWWITSRKMLDYDINY